MAGDLGKVLLEGSVWLWDREDETTSKTWLPRWCMINKVGIQNRLMVRIYRSMKHSAIDSQGHEVAMENFCGIEAFTSPFEGQPYGFSLITYHQTYCIAVSSRDSLQSWMDSFTSEVGLEWTFNVNVLPTRSIVPAGEATMRFYRCFFSLTNGTPPLCLGLWQHNHLRRYGGQHGFSFESGSRSIGGPEVYRLSTNQGMVIKDLFDCVAHGRTLPDPPTGRRTMSVSTVSTSFDDSDTWSMTSTPASWFPHTANSSSSFAFANDTISLGGGSAYGLCEEPREDATPERSGPRQRQRAGDYHYVPVDLPRRAPNEKDVNYLSVQLGGSAVTSPSTPSLPPKTPTPAMQSSTSTTSIYSTASTGSSYSAGSTSIYSGVDLQKTAQLRDALVQSGRKT